MPNPVDPRCTVLVTGDVVVDHHVYVGECRRPSDADGGKSGTAEAVEFGGAALIERLLDSRADKEPAPWRAVLGLVKQRDLYPHCYAIWEPSAAGGNVWRATQELGYGPWHAEWPADDRDFDGYRPARQPENADTSSADRGVRAFGCPQIDPAAPVHPDILVVDDSGVGFRSLEACWPACLDTKTPPQWLIWKMSGDLRGGALWNHVRSGVQLAARTVLVVSAEDLRRADLAVSRGLSWERSALDAARELRSTSIEPLAACRHVVVSFQGAGALWADLREKKSPRFTLVYDPRGIEADPSSAAPGQVFGYQACLAAGIVWGLASAKENARPEAERAALLDGVRRGLMARRLLFTEGHGQVGAKPPQGFPAARIRDEALRPAPQSFPHVTLPDSEPANSDSWTLLQSAAARCGVTGPLYDDARLVAMNGISALAGMPSLHLGAFSSVDRREIESLRRIHRLVVDYEKKRPERDAPTKPLSIALFGAPGSGKSFIVRELAGGVFGKDPPFLEFNLSQVSDEQDLIGAFHRVRDKVLLGRTPFVFWDEFDSQEYRWLRLLLAPMQDGTFQEGQTVHPIGKCVFVFAGGTSSTFNEFGPATKGLDRNEAAREARAWRLRKGRDFVSRVHDHLDVLGPNPRALPEADPVTEPESDPTDVCFPIRRALFIRSRMKLRPNERPEIDVELLDALLRVPRYAHGARSFEKILISLIAGGVPLRRSSLPPRDALVREIDGKVDGVASIDWLPTFLKQRRAEHQKHEEVRARVQKAIEARLDEFAAWINAAYMTLDPGLRNPDIVEEFGKLSEFNKDSNREAARRIPAVLAAAGLRIVEKATEQMALTVEPARAWLERFLDLAAEKEHEGWCEFHTSRDWRHADIEKKDKDKKLHPALVAWESLSETNGEKDRRQVRIYLNIVYDLGFAVAVG